MKKCNHVLCKCKELMEIERLQEDLAKTVRTLRKLKLKLESLEDPLLKAPEVQREVSHMIEVLGDSLNNLKGYGW